MDREENQPTVPCALSGYLRARVSTVDVCSPTEQDRQMAFLNWVAYVKELSPDMRQEHLKCPMFKCRQGGFQDMASFLSHVSNCNWLMEADYWCPSCCKQEHFGAGERLGESSVPREVGKDTKLKRARDFFRRFGRASCKNIVGQSQPKILSSDDFGQVKCLTTDDEQHSIRRGGFEAQLLKRGMRDYDKARRLDEAGLGAGESTLRIQGDESKRHLRKIPQKLRFRTQTKEPNLCYDELMEPLAGTEMPSLPFPTLEIPGPSSEAFRWSIPWLDHPVHDTLEHNELVSPLSPKSAREPPKIMPVNICPSVSILDIEHAHQFVQGQPDFSSTQSPTYNVIEEKPDRYNLIQRSPGQDRSIPCSGQTDPYSCDDEIPLDREVIGSSNQCIQYASQVVVEDDRFRGCKGTSAKVAGNGNQNAVQVDLTFQGEGSPKEVLVESLNQLVCELNDRWQRFLVRWPETRNHFNGMDIMSPLKEGFRGLNSCLRGSLPTTLREVFSFIHLGFACAYLFHGHDDSYAWDTFYHNVLQWGEAISEQRDRYCYSLIVELLYSAPQVSLSPTSMLLPAYRHSVEASIGAQITCDSTFIARCTNFRWQQDVMPIGSTILSPDFQRALRGGIVVEECMRFLDEFAYVNIMERIHQNPTASGRSCVAQKQWAVWMERVVEPLLQQPFYGDFPDAIEETKQALSLGYLSSIWEVEVTLIAKRQQHDGDDGKHAAFRKAVTLLCDGAVQSSGICWRNEQRASYVECVETIAMELDKKRDTTVDWPSISGDLPSSSTGAAQVVYKSPSVGQSTGSPVSSRSMIGNLPAEACQSICTTPSSATFHHRSASTNSLTSCTSSFTMLSQESKVKNSTSGTSPTSSISPITPSSSKHFLSSPMGPPTRTDCPPSRSVTYCHLCNERFTGNRQNRNSNKRRHLKSAHNDGKHLACGEAECNEEFGRADYRHKHRRTEHNIEDPIVPKKRQRRCSDAEGLEAP